MTTERTYEDSATGYTGRQAVRAMRRQGRRAWAVAQRAAMQALVGKRGRRS
jgi:hypothetical protein